MIQAHLRSPARLAGAAACAVLAGAALASDPAQAREDRCPWPLALWSISQQTVAGAPWSFHVVEFHDGVARERSIDAWLAVPEIGEEDRRWFAPEIVDPVPTFVAVRSRVASWTELGDLCAALLAGGIAAFQDEAGSSCGEFVVSIVHAGTGFGIRAGPRPDDERCPRSGEPASALLSQGASASIVLDLGDEQAPGPEAREDDPLPGAAEATLRAWNAYLAEVREAGDAAGGLTALPTARALIDVALDLDPASVPESLMAEAHLALAAGAPGPYVLAEARAALDRPRSRDELLSLLWLLGDRPDTAAAGDLVLTLRRAPDDPEVVALALRALAHTDPAAARREAVGLLGGSSGCMRAAVGVFAVTEAGFDAALDAVDPADENALREAADAIVRRIEAGVPRD